MKIEPTMLQQLNTPAELCLKYIEQTNRNIFLTGKAGTGKTTLLKKIMLETSKQTLVVAPTGIAALNAGGVTIHSLFFLPFGTIVPDFSYNFQAKDAYLKLEFRESLSRNITHYNKVKLSLLRNLELLIIDEVSMLRADILDAIDFILRKVRNSDLSFGGVQLLFIGDLMQLPPVVKPDEWNVLQHYYKGIYFFNALCLQQNPPLYIELDKIYRQSDQKFISILNQLRNNQLEAADLQFLNRYVQPDFHANNDENYITLTSHNRKADSMNEEALRELSTKSRFYEAEITGDFPENIFPIEEKLELKVGAQVMFVKNDASTEKRYYNGKIGVVDYLDDEDIYVLFPEENRKIKVEKYEWENKTYKLDEKTNEITEKTVGTFVQFPLRLAWAITIHKSQGLTFDKAILDVSQVFAPGQAYVALSRLRSLDGLILKSPFRIEGISSDQDVVEYARSKNEVDELNQKLGRAKMDYLHQLLQRTFDWYNFKTEWRKHVGSYKKLGPKSEKFKSADWAQIQLQKVQEMVDVSKKFLTQINRIFSQQTIDVDFLKERVSKAFDHFYKQIDDLEYSLLKKRFQLSRVKKIREFQKELEDLDDVQVDILQQLLRMKSIVDAILADKTLVKSQINVLNIVEYRKQKLLNIQNELSSTKSSFDFDATEDMKEIAEISSKTKKKTPKEKVEKIPTHLITKQLLEEGKSIEEIAKERLFTVSTIYGHCAKLVRAGEIELTSVMTLERYQFIDKKLKDFPSETLYSELKAASGDSVDYGEIKLYLAYRDVSQPAT